MLRVTQRLASGRLHDREGRDRGPRTAPFAAGSKTALAGRILLAAIFMVSGIAKVTDPTGSAAHMTAAGIPAADILVWVAGLAEIAGALALIFGFLARLGAAGLILFLIPTTLLFHDFWSYEGAEQIAQMASFLKNVGLVGGLLLLIAAGPGRYSLDHKIRHRGVPVLDQEY